MTQYLLNFQLFSGNTLKIIAIIAMLINHFTQSVVSIYTLNYSTITGLEWNDQIELFSNIICTIDLIGKIAFPIFAFLIVEGYQHTRSKKKYALKMLFFAFISELPFDLAFFWTHSLLDNTWPFYWGYQNVFFTLFLSIVALYGIEQCMQRFNPIIGTLLAFCITLIPSCIADFIIYSDWEGHGIWAIALMYYFRKNRILQVIGGILPFAMYHQLHPIQLVGFLLILLYNGKRGKLKLKSFFYWVYPAHLILFTLWGIFVKLYYHLPIKFH